MSFSFDDEQQGLNVLSPLGGRWSCSRLLGKEVDRIGPCVMDEFYVGLREPTVPDV